MAEAALDKLEGLVAIVLGGDRAIGRDAAIAVGARGVKIVVAGADERALGEAVGYIAYGGGKARHVVGGASEAIAKATSVFEKVDLAIVCVADAEAARAFEGELASVARVVVAIEAKDGAIARDDAADAILRACAEESARRVVTLTIAGESPP